jgi:hypothetical protein
MPDFPLLIQDVEQRKMGVLGGVLMEQDKMPATFPFELWSYQINRYTEYWRWFTGEVWRETIPNTENERGEPEYRYPLAINHVRMAAFKRAYTLFGEVPDNASSIFPAIAEPRKDPSGEPPTDEQKRLARELEFFINDVWRENEGRARQQENGVIQQFLGGCVFRARYAPDEPDLRHHIVIENILPDFFMPVWEANRPDNLLEAFIVYRITPREAMHLFGSSIQTNSAYVLYVEHWTKDEIHITVNGEPINYTVDIEDQETGERETFVVNFDHAPNPFGEIPIVYIPAERFGGYWGEGAIDITTKHLSREINARLADLGDAISEGTHSDIYIKNVRGSITTTDAGGPRPVINLGVTTAGQPEPDARRIEPPNIPAAMADFPDKLEKQFERHAFVPPVASGEDEGSQRSALTLAFRMFPLVAKARAMRSYWQAGLTRFNKILVKMAIKMGEGGMTWKHLSECDLSIKFYPMIPRDREQEVNEAVLLMQANSLSPKTALDLLDKVADPSEEYENIREHLEWMAELSTAGSAASQQDIQPSAQTQVQAPIATSGQDNL